MPPTDSNKEKPSILKDTREAKGLTLDIVHEATKIPLDALKAIEEGYSVRSLSPFYYRGFIKIYAEFLGLDVGETYKHYGIDQPSVKPVPSSVLPVKSRRPSAPAEPNVFLEQLQEGMAFIFKPKTLMLIVKIIGFLILIILLFKMAGCVASHLHKKEMSPKRQAGFYAPDRRVTAAPEASHHESVQAPSDNNKVEVAVRADRDTWLQVKADGHVVFQMTLSKGSMESWSADERIELSGRDIEQLDMEVNGKHVGSLGGGERRIRKVLVTQEGLTVKK